MICTCDFSLRNWKCTCAIGAAELEAERRKRNGVEPKVPSLNLDKSMLAQITQVGPPMPQVLVNFLALNQRYRVVAVDRRDAWHNQGLAGMELQVVSMTELRNQNWLGNGWWCSHAVNMLGDWEIMAPPFAGVCPSIHRISFTWGVQLEFA